MTDKRISADALQALGERVLIALDLPPANARTVAGLMVKADLFGADGHGIFRLRRYVDRLRAGGFNPRPNIAVERQEGATALVDGDNGMGHLVMRRCADLAMDLAEKFGVGWVGAHHSNHAGAAILYSTMALERDMIGIYIAVGSANHLPPWGGTEMLLSTNPISVAVPSDRDAPVVLDMATTVAAYGKVKTAAARGETMPEGWMIDKQGKPLTDPKRANEGFLLPIGGPKGYGLALIFGLLAGTLNGAALGRDLIDFNADATSVTNTGQTMIAVSPRMFGDSAQFKTSVGAIADTMKSSPLLPGFGEIRLPGERAYASLKEKTAHGIPLPESLIRDLNRLAAECGVAPLSVL
jgi:L-2-hydroxycarboxylate dehydrogenase (NAD+)